MLVVDAHIRIPKQELRRTATRSSGPGGQNVNKVNSKVTLRWDVVHSPSLPPDVRGRFLQQYQARLTARGELVLHSQRYRDQPRNWEDCLARLRRLILAVRHPPARRRATKPSGAARERRLLSKRHTARKKHLRRRPAAAD